MKAMRGLLSALLAICLFVIGGFVATSASAHTHAVDARCDALDVTLTSYDNSGLNHVTVTIDGATVADENFSASYDETFGAPDRTKPYAYVVTVTAHDDTQFSFTESGTSKACQQPGVGHIPVNVCHATNSDSNPYVFITVDANSTRFQGHLAHRNTPNKTWKSDTVFNGVLYPAGSKKRDFIADYINKNGNPVRLDGNITEAFCKAAGVPPESPSGDLSGSCVNNAGQVTTANLKQGTATTIEWRLVTGTAADHTTVLASGSGNGDLSAANLADGTVVWLQYRTSTHGSWVDEGSDVTTGNCAPPPGPTCDQLKTDRSQFLYTVNGVTYTYSGFITFPTMMTQAHVALKPGVTVPQGCQIPFSLASYETDGPTWPSSGSQEFLGHDTDAITSTVSAIDLSVPEPSCFGQSDLYTGTKKYDGVDNPLPHYNDSIVPPAGELIGAWNGQHGACMPKAQVQKVTDPAGAEGGWSFTLTEPGGTTQTLTTLAGGLSQSVDLTKLGTYTITEQPQSGWEQAPWKITQGGQQVQSCTFTVTNFKADKDKTYGCTFYNRQLAELIVDKVTVPAGSTQSFHFAASGPNDYGSAFDLTDQAAAWHSGKVGSGTYSVAESPTDGWQLKNVVCSDDSAPGQIVLAPGETVTCTFTNEMEHRVPTLDKSSPNEGATVPLGSTIHYKVAVGNTGNAPITSRPVVDTLPDGVTFVAGSSTSATTGGGTASAAPATGTSGGHNTLTWTVTLPPAATATLEFDVTVNSDNPRAAELKNTAAFENLTDFTVHTVGIPNPTLDKFANPATTDSSPALVPPGTRIDYSVRVGNTGNLPINAPVVDTLPNNVTLVAGTISDAGTPSGDGRTITWSVTLAPGANKTLTYAVTVDQAAPQGAVLVNTAKFQNLTDTTTHVVPTGALTLVKGVTPVAAHGVAVEFGDTLTYTLTASATGTLGQQNVVVTDYLPGHDPARPKSGSTTYVAGSARCLGAGTCTVTGPDAHGLITWSLGDMAAGTSRQVTFKVVIDDVAGTPGETVSADIVNAGAVKSDQTPVTPSNEVTTPVTKVLGVKIHKPKPPKIQGMTLPHTGVDLPLGGMVGGGIGLLLIGSLILMAASRPRRMSS